MKILFIADIHIKLGQKNVPIPWALNRYKNLIDQIDEIQSTVDVIILGGDIFDKLPNMEELDIYFKLVKTLCKPTYIIDGNHEATRKGQTFFTQLAFVTHELNPLVNIVDDFKSTNWGVDFIPYCKLKEFEKNGFGFFSNDILVTHVRGNIPPHVKSEVDLDIFNSWKVVLAGDLHAYANSQLNILYPGSPMTISFHRNEVENGVIVLDTETLQHEWVKLDLPQLIRKTIRAGDAMPATSPNHTIYEIEGDMSELSGLEDNELIDKKLVKRSTDTSLILAPDLTLEEEVSEYLEFILELKDEEIDAALKELSNYANQLNR